MTKEVLIPAETIESLAAAISNHLTTCNRDHCMSFHQQSGIVEFNPALSTLRCQCCNVVEPLNKPPADGTQIDTYCHHLLIQQQRFYDAHYSSCVVVH